MSVRRTEPLHEQERQQSTIELVRGIANDTTTLVKKEVELARHEIVEAVSARLMAAGAFGVGGVCAMFGVLFGAAAVAAALALVLPVWASLLIVMGAFLGVAGVAAFAGVAKVKSPPLAPEETQRTIKEDVEWAKEALKR